MVTRHYYLFIFYLLAICQFGFSQYNPSLNITTPISDIKTDGHVDYTTTNAAVNDGRFTLLGDGYFNMQNNFSHQFPKDPKGFETSTHFNQRYKKHGPIIRKKTTGQTGSGGGTNKKISIDAGTNSKVGASWSPSTGIENYFMLIFENTSSTIDSGCMELYFMDTDVSLNFPGVLDYGWVVYNNNKSVSGSTLYNRKLIWDFKGLNPGEQRVVYVPMTAKVKPGSLIDLGSRYSSGCNSNAEILNFEFLVNGSPHDPNVKIVDEQCVGAFQPMPQTVTYTIKFQNEGTAPAVNVILNDIIDIAHLDINSVIFLDAEYPYTYSISGALLSITFANINLPGLNQTYPKTYSYEETESYIKFQLCTWPFLSPGVIVNQADIIFDTQPPITTNQVSVPINDECQWPVVMCNPGPISTSVTESIEENISVAPNPVNDLLFVHGIGNQEVSVNIFNSRGELVKSKSGINKEIDFIEMRDVSSGLYFVQIKNEFLNITRKVIKI